MKPVQEWDENDLIRLISDQVQESLQLDYKESAALDRSEKAKLNLSKDVSAFANSAGGQIIYGIREIQHIPDSIDEGSNAEIISREWIEQVINSTIQPRIAGLTIKAIPLSSGGTAYIIDIPQATTLAPHQAKNNVYYKRYNFQCIPMQDYEVRDILRRANVGDPYIRFYLTNGPIISEGALKAQIKIYGGNRAIEPITCANLKLFIDQRLVPENLILQNWDVHRDAFCSLDIDHDYSAMLLSRNIMIPHHMPFFKGSEWLMLDLLLPAPRDGAYLLGYTFSAPGVAREMMGLFDIIGFNISARTDETEALLSDGLIYN